MTFEKIELLIGNWYFISNTALSHHNLSKIKLETSKKKKKIILTNDQNNEYNKKEAAYSKIFLSFKKSISFLILILKSNSNI
jgi:hypothetical protein